MLKKVCVIVVFLFVFVLSLASAIEIEINDVYNQGETLIAKITGVAPPGLSSEQVFLYRAHVRDPTLFDIFSINNSYYIFTNLPLLESNYSFWLKNVKYSKGGNVLKGDFSRNFTISNESAIFSIEVNSILAESGFFISFENLIDKTIVIDFSTLEKVSSEEGEVVKESFWNSIFGSGDSSEDIPDESEKISSFELGPWEKRKVFFNLTGTENFGMQFFYFSSDRTSYKVPVYILEFPDEEIINESLGNFSDEPDIVIIVNNTEISDGDDDEILLERCSSLKGIFCDNNQTCEGNLTTSLDGKCCIGKCKDEKKGGSFLKIIGWLLVVAVVIFLLWFFMFKYRGAKKSFNLLDVARKGAGKGVE